jgi:hypothetical protein
MEDVFYLFERTSNYYYDNDSDICDYEQIVFPYSIGNIWASYSFNRKCYIRCGEECSICLEPIIRKIDAYLTACGHPFHKKCIFKAMETKWYSNCRCCFSCPYCRSKLGLTVCYLNQRYNPLHSSYTYLDRLEDFWLRKEYFVCEPCILSNEDNQHFSGMDSGCIECLLYRKNK